MEEFSEQVSPIGSETHTGIEVESSPSGEEISELDVVMCYKYPDLECLDPQDCPKVYASCWQYRVWNR